MIYPKLASQIREADGSTQIWFGKYGPGKSSNFGKMSG